MKINKSLILVLSSVLILSSCAINKKGSTSESETPGQGAMLSQIDPAKASLKPSEIPQNYEQQVNLNKLVGMPQLNAEQSASLLKMLQGKEPEYRKLVEQDLVKQNLKYEEICLGLNGTLCDFNNEIYKGSRFGIMIYDNVTKKKMIKEKNALNPAQAWSVNWINVSVDHGVKLISTCSQEKEFASCVSKNSENPITSLYAICSYSGKDATEIDKCLADGLLSKQGRDFAFDIGFISGYSIAYSADNNVKYKDMFDRKL